MKTKRKLKPKPAEEVRRCGCKARGVPRRAKKKQAKGTAIFKWSCTWRLRTSSSVSWGLFLIYQCNSDQDISVGFLRASCFTSRGGRVKPEKPSATRIGKTCSPSYW